MVYRVDRNNFYKKQKNSTINTPHSLSYFLFKLLKNTITYHHKTSNNNIQKSQNHKNILAPIKQQSTHSKNDSSPQPLILDPCVGSGSLLKPFSEHGFECIGIDIQDQGFKNTLVTNYLELSKEEIKTPDIVIMNPPFNIDITTKIIIKKKYSSRPLLPEIWLQKTIELFGKDIPMVLFTPYGFRLNQTQTSARWKKFIHGTYPEITSIISLPKNVFHKVLFHSEILIFNIHGLKTHYFYQSKY